MNRLKLLWVLWASLLLGVFVGVAHAGPAELVDPAPVRVANGLSVEQVQQDIRRALAGRGWTVSQERPGAIEASLFLRVHEARIGIAYDAAQLQIRYLDSANLEYEEDDGVRYIHGNYLGWIGFLVQDMQAGFGKPAGG